MSAAGDSLAFHDGSAFSTWDQDNDAADHGSCAYMNHGAWWYASCQYANLNGRYLGTDTGKQSGMRWKDWPHDDFKTVDMKLRPQ